MRFQMVWVLGVILLSPGWVRSLQNQMPREPTLLEPVVRVSPHWIERLARDPVVVRFRFVRVRTELFRPMETRVGLPAIRLNLFPDVAFSARQIRMVQRADGSVSWWGRIPTTRFGYAILVIRGDILSGKVVVTGRVFDIRPLEGRLHAVREIRPERFPLEHPPLIPPGGFPQRPAQPPAAPGFATAVDVLVVYTPQAEETAVGIENDIQLAIDEMNFFLENSRIPARVTLVAIRRVDYRDSGDLLVDIRRLTHPNDGYLDEVHTIRAQLRADVVSLWVGRRAVGACGYGWLLCGMSPEWASFMFNVMTRSCAVGREVFAHEVGHNWGSMHDWFVDPDYCLFPYAHGYVYVPGRWRTVMAYNDRCQAEGVTCSVIPYFSNPDVAYQGVPVGVPADQDEPADNRRTFRNTAPLVSQFYRRCVPEALTPPILVYPFEGAVGLPPTPVFIWEGNDAVRYAVQIARDPDFQDIVRDDLTSGTTRVFSVPLEMGTTYYWRVRAQDDCGVGPWSPVRHFTTLVLPGR